MLADRMGRRIEGIVISAGAGSRGGAKWDLILFLCPWREVGHEIVRRQLRLLVPMKDRASTSRALDEWKGKAVALALDRLKPPSEKLQWGLAYGRPPLERIRVDAALRTVSVVIGDTRTTAYFGCDDLFLDHVIEVRMSPAGRITEICLAG
jgi:hypothetical protein